MHPAPRTLEQKKLWIAYYVSPTLKMIQIADDNLEEDFLKNIIEETALKKQQKKIMEDYLFSRKELHKGHEKEREHLQDIVYLRKEGFIICDDIENPF